MMATSGSETRPPHTLLNSPLPCAFQKVSKVKMLDLVITSLNRFFVIPNFIIIINLGRRV